MAFESDEENESPTAVQMRIKTRTEVVPGPPQPLPGLSEPPRLSELSPLPGIIPEPKPSSLPGSHSRDINLVRPGLIKRISRRLGPGSDSDDEPPVPLEIYSPRASSMTVDSVRFNSLGPRSPNYELSSDEEVILAPRRQHRLRHNQARRNNYLNSTSKRL